MQLNSQDNIIHVDFDQDPVMRDIVEYLMMVLPLEDFLYPPIEMVACLDFED